MKVDLNCLDPGNVHLNNLNALVLNVLSAIEVIWFYKTVNSVHPIPYTHISESIAAFDIEI